MGALYAAPYDRPHEIGWIDGLAALDRRFGGGQLRLRKPGCDRCDGGRLGGFAAVRCATAAHLRAEPDRVAGFVTDSQAYAGPNAEADGKAQELSDREHSSLQFGFRLGLQWRLLVERRLE